MRHRNHRGQLSRPNGPRQRLIRNLACALITNGRIKTTEARAKTIRPFVEKLITLGHHGDQHHRRLAFAKLQKKEAVTKLFGPIADATKTRKGGYTRITLAGPRMGDGSAMAYIEFIDEIAGNNGDAAATSEAASGNA